MSTATIAPPPRRHRRRPGDRVMNRLVNPAVAALLRSPLADLLGPRVALLELTGRRSGRRRRVPVNVAVAPDGALLAVSRRDRVWWRNLGADGAPVTAWVGGRPHPAFARRVAAPGADVAVRIELGAAPPPPVLAGRAFRRRWTRVTTAGELLGFVAPAVAGAAVAATGAPALVGLVALVVAGAVEGAVLGGAQALVLRRARPALSSRAWVGATSAGAALAYACALVPSSLGDRLDDLPPWLLGAGGAVLGGALLASIGGLQWRVLRAHAVRAGRWVAAAAVAWALGLAAFTAVATPLWHEGQPAAAIAGVGLLAAAAMALVVAATGGWAMARILSDRAPRTGAPAPAARS